MLLTCVFSHSLLVYFVQLMDLTLFNLGMPFLHHEVHRLKPYRFQKATLKVFSPETQSVHLLQSPLSAPGMFSVIDERMLQGYAGVHWPWWLRPSPPAAPAWMDAA